MEIPTGAPDNSRQRNLARILRIVHETRGLSRSRLTRATGLNRSTVGALVAELASRGLVVEEGAAAPTGVGRPSPVVLPHQGPVALAVNPELDAVTVGVVGRGARVHARLRHPVHHLITPEETTAIVTGMVRELERDVLADRRLLGVGIAVPGLVRSTDGLVRWAPHLEWTDAPIARLMSDALGIPASAANDASLGASAERLFGTARGADDVIYLNGGASGIGGGVISGGRLLSGARGYAGEFGQNRPGVKSIADRKTHDGTLEDEVNRARLLAVVGLDDADEEQLEAALLSSTNAAVLAELARQRRILSVALSNAINVLNPELVVLGGFLSTLLSSNPDELESLVAAQSVAAAWEQTSIRPAGLGPELLMIGAAELVFDAVTFS